MRPKNRTQIFLIIKISLIFCCLFFLLMGCDGDSVETAPSASSEQAVSSATLSPTATIYIAAASESGGEGEIVLAAETAEIAQPTPEATASNTPIPNQPIPTPLQRGINPQDATQFWVRDAGPEAAQGEEWRPPALEVPVAIHPDDHYFLARPIPSGSRNYDLPWYPFGNDVQLPTLPSYRIHHGVDFPNDTGTPVLAASSGTVIHAGPLPSPRNGVNYYGNTVVIRHDWQVAGQEVYTLYAHTLELFVAVGDRVQQGQLIAGVGSSGEVSGPHLHFEVRLGQNRYADAVNPALWLSPYEGWGTLAGRLVDRRGRYITNAQIIVRALDGSVPERRQRTYALLGMKSDPFWEENFVVGDLPAGRYQLLIDVGGIQYEREVNLLPGRTNFEVISTTFEFVPTVTPVPEETADPNATVDPNVTVEPEATPEG